MIRRISRMGALAVAGWAISVGCTDRLPTLTDVEEIVGGTAPVTLEERIGAADFLRGTLVVEGSATPGPASELLVAHDYAGALEAHLLAHFTGFPDTITVDGQRDGEFLYLNSQVLASVPDTLAQSAPQLDFFLWTIEQPWDVDAVSWQNAVDRGSDSTPWREPGGTRGELVGVAHWSRGATGAAADSLKWDISGATLTRLARNQASGLMVTLEDQSARGEISRLTIRAAINPSVKPDTLITQTISSGTQRYIFTPAPPAPAGVLSTGGLRADRTVLQLAFPDSLPGCTPAAGPCAKVATGEVVLNRVELLLDPLPVAEGFGPVAPIIVTVRRVLDPALGEQAPLGELIGQQRIAADRFSAGSAPVAFPITQAVANTFAMNRTDLAVALLVEPQSSTFSFAWFDRNPRLRFVYTLPQHPRLP